MGGHRLARVDSRGQEYSFLLPPVIEVGDDDAIAVIPRNSLAQSLPLQHAFPAGAGLDFPQEVLQPGVGVGIAVGDVDRVVVIWSREGEYVGT